MGHLEHSIRFWYVPAIHKLARSRRILRIALDRAAINPGDQSIDLRLSQRTIVPEMAESGIGEPRWHLARQDRRLDRLGPGPRLLIGKQRHWPDFAGAVAFLAPVLQNRHDAFVKGHRRFRQFSRQPTETHHSEKGYDSREHRLRISSADSRCRVLIPCRYTGPSKPAGRSSSAPSEAIRKTWSCMSSRPQRRSKRSTAPQRFSGDGRWLRLVSALSDPSIRIR